MPYAGPVRYFVLWITILQIFVLWSGNVLDLASGFVEGRGGPAATGGVDEVAVIIAKYYIIGLAGFVPILTLWTRVLFLRSGHNLAEHAVFHLYLGGQLAFYIIAAYVVEGLAGDPYASIAMGIALLAWFGATVWAATQFFRVGRWHAVLGILAALLLSYFSYLVVWIVLVRFGSVLWAA